MNTGEALRQKRLSKKISLRKLAKSSGIAPSTIYRIEKNESQPRRSTIKVIELALDSTEDTACQTTDDTENQ